MLSRMGHLKSTFLEGLLHVICASTPEIGIPISAWGGRCMGVCTMQGKNQVRLPSPSLLPHIKCFNLCLFITMPGEWGESCLYPFQLSWLNLSSMKKQLSLLPAQYRGLEHVPLFLRLFAEIKLHKLFISICSIIWSCLFSAFPHQVVLFTCWLVDIMTGLKQAPCL